METKANYVRVGLFVFVGIVAMFSSVFWYGDFFATGKFAKALIRVPGSGAGLNVGSPVRFNGLPVGQVKSVHLDSNDPKYIVALAEIKTTTPMNDSSIIRLETQALSGAASFEISTPEGRGSDKLELAHGRGETLIFTAETSGIANLIETAEDIMGRADDVMEQVQTFVVDAQEPLTNTLKNAEVFSKAVADNADGIDEFLKSVSGLSATIQTLSVRVDGTLATADKLLTAIDPEKINNSLANIETLTKNANTSLAKVDLLISEIEPEQISTTVSNIVEASNDAKQALNDAKIAISTISESADDVSTLMTDVGETAKKLNQATARVDNILAEIQPGQIGQTVANITKASDDAQVVIGEARKVIEVIGGRSGDIDQMITDVSVSVAKFNQLTDNIEVLVAEVDPAIVKQTLADISSASTNAKDAMDDVRQVVGNVNGRSADIDQMITDVGEIASRLNAASSRVDGVLAKLDGFLGEGDASSLLADAQETLNAFKGVADSLNSRIGPIAGNLERFTGAGLQDIEALVAETRRSVSRIERSITSIERDPQRLLFGGDTVKQFDGRTRR